MESPASYPIAMLCSPVVMDNKRCDRYLCYVFQYPDEMAGEDKFLFLTIKADNDNYDKVKLWLERRMITT